MPSGYKRPTFKEAMESAKKLTYQDAMSVKDASPKKRRGEEMAMYQYRMLIVKAIEQLLEEGHDWLPSPSSSSGYRDRLKSGLFGPNSTPSE